MQRLRVVAVALLVSVWVHQACGELAANAQERPKRDETVAYLKFEVREVLELLGADADPRREHAGEETEPSVRAWLGFGLFWPLHCLILPAHTTTGAVYAIWPNSLRAETAGRRVVWVRSGRRYTVARMSPHETFDWGRVRDRLRSHGLHALPGAPGTGRQSGFDEGILFVELLAAEPRSYWYGAEPTPARRDHEAVRAVVDEVWAIVAACRVE